MGVVHFKMDGLEVLFAPEIDNGANSNQDNDRDILFASTPSGDPLRRPIL